jgi:DNA-binding transcriptional LysR family regulator
MRTAAAMNSLQTLRTRDKVWDQRHPKAPGADSVGALSTPGVANGRPTLTAISRSASRRTAAPNIDLKLLAIIDELHRTRSVSHTAENLHLSQSAVSMSLARLRRHFKDPLFVRTAAGMEPTPHALEVVALFRKAEGLIRSALEHHATFAPATSERVFRLSSTDIAQLTLLPRLMRRIKQVAPSVAIHLSPVSGSIPTLLESGEIDLAVGFIPPMGAGFYQQRLFSDRFICALRAGHPRIAGDLTLKQFEEETHLTVATSGTGHSILERTLEANRIRRKVGLRVPTFLGLAPILATTDYLAVLPEQLGRFFASSGEIKLLPLPFAVAPYFIQQHWHERYNHDPANVWLRGILAELFLQ